MAERQGQVEAGPGTRKRLMASRACAGLEELLHLLVRLAAGQFGVHVEADQVGDPDAEVAAELADHDPGDEGRAPLAALPGT